MAKIADNTRDSNRTVAKISKAALKDFGLVFSGNPVNLIKKNRGELHKKKRIEQKTTTEGDKGFKAISFRWKER